MRNNLLVFALGIVGFVFLMVYVSAAGVTSGYYDGSPLVMSPGETKDIYLELQNMVGDKDITFKADIVNGSSIAKIIDKSDIYEVPFGRKDVKVNIKVEIPENATAGEKYNIGLSFRTVKTEGAGQLQFGQAIDKYFDVLVIAPVKEKSIINSSNFWITLAIIVIVIIIIIYFLRRKN